MKKKPKPRVFSIQLCGQTRKYYLKGARQGRTEPRARAHQIKHRDNFLDVLDRRQVICVTERSKIKLTKNKIKQPGVSKNKQTLEGSTRVHESNKRTHDQRVSRMEPMMLILICEHEKPEKKQKPKPSDQETKLALTNASKSSRDLLVFSLCNVQT